jgi:hypothetical protein
MEQKTKNVLNVTFATLSALGIGDLVANIHSQEGWRVLEIGTILGIIIFPDWRHIFGRASRATAKSAPQVGSFARTRVHDAKNNILAAAAIASALCFVLFGAVAALAGSQEWAQVALFTLYASIAFAIAHFKGWKHFADNWKVYWLAISVVGTVHSLTFGHKGGVIAVFALSAIMAVITLVEGWGNVFELLGKGVRKTTNFLSSLLSGKYGKPQAYLAWMVLLILIAMIFPALAFPAMTAAVGCFIASIMVGVSTQVNKK